MEYSLRAVSAALLMVGVLAGITDGFAGFTYESIRRASTATDPVALSNWRLEDASGNDLSLRDFDNKTLLINFIFTRCPTVCRALGSRYRQLQQVINHEGLEHVQLLSISVDPEFDTPERLAHYHKAHGGSAESWTVARPLNQATFKDMLDETGLRVIADPVWGLAHSQAIHVVQNGILKRIQASDSAELESLISALAAS